jgi:hypothetical protein
MAGGKYAKYLIRDFKSAPPPFAADVIAGPQVAFRGAKQIPGANANFGCEVFVKPIFLEKEPHTHPADEYLIFLGAQLPDLFANFDAEIDFWIGEEQEKYVITEPTLVFIPKGLPHTPLNFRKINKPVLFGVILLTPRFTVNVKGKEISYDGPDR